MLKYTLLMIAVPLGIANVSVNVVFWSSHVEGIFADTIASLWAVGLTLVEVLFPAWAITQHHYCKTLSILFYVVGCTTAVFSILVFAMTIDNTLSHHMESLERNEQAKIQEQEKNQLQKKLTHIQLQAAQTAIDAANKYNEVDKISLGTMPAIKQANILAEKIHRSLQEKREENKKHTHPHTLAYLLTLEKVTGIPRNTLKITLAIILGLLVEVSVILAIAALAQTKRDQRYKIKELPVDSSELKPAGEHSQYNKSNKDHEETDTQSTTTKDAHNYVDNNSDDTTNNLTENLDNELTLLARVRRDILMGKFGDVPKLSELPKEYPGTGLRYPQVQKLRDQMIQDGEAIREGKSRMRLKRVGDDNE